MGLVRGGAGEGVGWVAAVGANERSGVVWGAGQVAKGGG